MLFTETAHFVVNFLLSRRPRATPPHRLDQELCFWGCRGPALPAPAARRSLGDYWLSPQRRRPAGAAWRWPARNLLLLPGATGLADVPSARWPSCYGSRPRLTWKHRWQNINYQFLGKRKRPLVPLRPSRGAGLNRALPESLEGFGETGFRFIA